MALLPGTDTRPIQWMLDMTGPYYTRAHVGADAPLRVVVDASDRAAAALRTALPVHARRRGVLVLVHGRGPVAPWCPSDATLASVVGGCIDAAIAARWDAIGRAPESVGALARIAAPSTDRRTLSLQLDGVRFELPRAWVGRHAIVVVPAVIDTMRDGRELGPFEASLAALAASARASGGDSPVAVGAMLLTSVFAGFTWFVDARRAVLRTRGTQSRASELAIERVFVHGHTGAEAAHVAAHAHTLDRWVATRDPSGVELEGAEAHDPWPTRTSVAVGVDGPLWSPPRVRREARR